MAHEPEQASGNGSDREQPRSNLHRISEWCGHIKNILGTAWLIGLTVGGLIFLIYYLSIGFMPELDLQASFTFLATAALTGIVIYTLLIMALTFPARMWVGIHRDAEGSALLSRIKPLHEVRQLWWRPEFSPWRAMACFALPIATVLAIFPYRYTFIARGWRLAVGIILLIATLIFLWKSFPSSLVQHGERLKKQPWARVLGKTKLRKKLTLLAVFAAAIVPSIIIFVLPLMVVDVLVRAVPKPIDRLDLVFYTCVGLVLINNAVLVVPGLDNMSHASSHPFLPTILIGSFILFILFSWLNQWTLLPKTVMYLYKFGNIHHAYLVVDKLGCNIIKYYNLGENLAYIENTENHCCLPNVTISSRLGNAYYVQVKGKTVKVEGKEKQPIIDFTIPTSHVSSWGTYSVVSDEQPCRRTSSDTSK